MFSRLIHINRVILSSGNGAGYNEKENLFDIGLGSSAVNNKLPKQIISNLALYLSANGLIVITLPDFGITKALDYINRTGDAYTDWAIEIVKTRNCSYDPSSMYKRLELFYHPISKENKDIASELTADLIHSGANPSSKIKPDTESYQGTLSWIRKPKMLSHIIEADFSKESDYEELVDFYSQSIASAICKALDIRFTYDILRA